MNAINIWILNFIDLIYGAGEKLLLEIRVQYTEIYNINMSTGILHFVLV